MVTLSAFHNGDEFLFENRSIERAGWRNEIGVKGTVIYYRSL